MTPLTEWFARDHFLRCRHTISVSPPLPPVGPSILVTSSVPRLDTGYGQGYQQPQTGQHQPPPHPCTEQVHRLNRHVDFLREMSFTNISSHTLCSVLSTPHLKLPVWFLWERNNRKHKNCPKNDKCSRAEKRKEDQGFLPDAALQTKRALRAVAGPHIALLGS